MPDPHPRAGEVRIRLAASGINPGDIKKRSNAFGYGMPYPRVIPHSDGAGRIDEIGDGVSSEWLGESVWCYGAQSYRAFGTAAEYTVVPVHQVARLPRGVAMDQGACLGIPGITAHRAVHISGPVDGRTVLIQGGAGAVGSCAVQLSRRAGARVIAVVRSGSMEPVKTAGAHEVVYGGPDVAAELKTLAPEGIDHIVEVAFDANLRVDLEVLKIGGSIATYATGTETPDIPFWPMVFQNTRVFFIGSDDFPKEAKVAATRELNAALEAGWPGLEIAERFPLEEIARAHELVEQPIRRARIVVAL
jgi:NADPH:quinone reductase